MSTAQRLLVFGGLGLAVLGMLYGLHYALFVEHQTLDRMGGMLVQGFVHAADRNMPDACAAIDTYGSVKYDYVRQVDVHSHWIGLAMLMIVLGAAFNRVALATRFQTLVASALLIGSFLFPFGVILQTAAQGAVLGRAMAILGSGLVTIALGAAVWGFSRKVASQEHPSS